MKFGEGMQPGTVEWEMNRRKFQKEKRKDEKEWAKLQATREREARSTWQRFLDLFKRSRA